MADIRIKDLATLESASLTGDVFVIDGTTGTRKLSAFSPTFGGNATVTGTLNVNGTDRSQMVGNANTRLEVGNSIEDQRAHIGLVQRLNLGNPIFSKNLAGKSASDAYTTIATTPASGYSGIECGYGGVIRLLNGTGATTAGAEVTPVNVLDTTTTRVAIPLTTASTSTSSGALVIGNGTSGGLGVGGTIYAANLGGTSTNNNAASGCIGEYASATTAYASKVSLTSNTAANIVSISLTAGDWDVQFNPVFTQDTSLTTSGVLAGVSSSSGVLPSGAAERAHSPSGPNGNSDLSIAPPVTRISLASTTTIYGVATGIFSAGTMSAYGFIRARRVR